MGLPCSALLWLCCYPTQAVPSPTRLARKAHSSSMALCTGRPQMSASTGAALVWSRRVPLVLPLDSRSQLAVQPEGLQLLRSITGPLAPVVIIGPYRSGKSFTLNQLIETSCGETLPRARAPATGHSAAASTAYSQSCHALRCLQRCSSGSFQACTLGAARLLHLAPADMGFGVGHTRATETKGIWIWGQPIPLAGGDAAVSAGSAAEASAAASGAAYGGAGGGANATQLLFIDTEGFESTGKANSYDDRIFALSALLSSLLIYNRECRAASPASAECAAALSRLASALHSTARACAEAVSQ
jgi:hypothetical protein